MSAEARLAPTTFYREIDRNRRRSWFLVAIVAGVLALLGGAIGYATGIEWGGVVLALVVAVVLSVGTYFAGDQLVAATTGLLEKLDREELQGVIGHEMSHIGNLDIRFTLLVGVMVGAIALLADWFLRITYWGGGRRSDNDRGGGGGAMALIFVLALVLSIVAPL